jgi:hypothetical protein
MRTSKERGPGAVASRTWQQASAAARLAARLGSDLGLDPIRHARIRALSVASDVGEQSRSLIDLAKQARRSGSADAASWPPADADTPRRPQQTPLSCRQDGPEMPVAAF